METKALEMLETQKEALKNEMRNMKSTYSINRGSKHSIKSKTPNDVSQYAKTPSLIQSISEKESNLQKKSETDQNLPLFVDLRIENDVIEKINNLARNPLTRKAILKTLKHKRKSEGKNVSKDKLRSYHYSIGPDSETYFKNRLARYLKQVDVKDFLENKNSLIYIPEMEKIANMPGRYIKDTQTSQFKGMTSVGIVIKKKAEFIPDKPYKYLSYLYMQKLALNVLLSKRDQKKTETLLSLETELKKIYMNYEGGQVEKQREIENILEKMKNVREDLSLNISLEEKSKFFEKRPDLKNDQFDILEYVKVSYPSEYEKIKESKKKRMFRNGENVYDPFTNQKFPAFTRPFHIIGDYILSYADLYSVVFIRDFVEWFLFIASPSIEEGEIYNIRAFEGIGEIYISLISRRPK